MNNKQKVQKKIFKPRSGENSEVMEIKHTLKGSYAVYDYAGTRSV